LLPSTTAPAGGRGGTVTIGGDTKHVMACVDGFLFRPEQARTPQRVPPENKVYSQLLPVPLRAIRLALNHHPAPLWPNGKPPAPETPPAHQ
jgi:hypothetical protein